MKKAKLLFQPLIICLLAACAFQSEADWSEQLPGTYVSQYQQTYSTGWDTLILQPVKDGDSKRFQLERHTKYLRTLNGKPLPATLKITTRQVETHGTVLLHVASGRRYYYDPTKAEISTGNTIYHKLK